MQALFTQVTQQVACNGLHSVEERCSRWMLLTHDRVGSDSFPLTEEFRAEMLGVRRASVTVAAGAQQTPGSFATTGDERPSSTGRVSKRPLASVTASCAPSSTGYCHDRPGRSPLPVRRHGLGASPASGIDNSAVKAPGRAGWGPVLA